jgi:hypothetical protein
MPRHHTVITKKFDFLHRQGYPSLRYDFRPTAYVVLTREVAPVMEEAHG